MIDQNEIHNRCLSEDPEERKKALEQLEYNFLLLPDKEQAWNELIKLITDKNYRVCSKAADALSSVFTHVPDKQQAWEDVHKLSNHDDYWISNLIIKVFGSIFSQLPDKQKAWEDLHRLINDEVFVRVQAVSSLVSAFFYIPDKQQAWKDLIKMTNDLSYDVRYVSSFALCSIVLQVPDKQEAWNDLIILTSHKESYMRNNASYALGFVFTHVTNKQKAWNELIKTITDNSYVSSLVGSALGSAFSNMPDKDQAWNDLHRLINDKNTYVRVGASYAIGSAFSHVPNKQQAWNDLRNLIKDKNSTVRSGATSSLGSAFSHLSDKQQGWNDLRRLVNDKDSSVRETAASALGSIFLYIPDKQQAWNDLYKLSNDQNRYVRIYANHSLGKVSIFKASQAEREEDYKKELEKAIEFFEKVAYESPNGWLNPSQFCLPFYRSFHTIVFKKQEAKKEVEKYLAEAKDAVRGSKNKELLFEAVNNLTNALKEVQNIENLDLETKKGELNHYRKYCDRAAELMRDTEKTAPFATGAMRKGLPILDRNLKELLEEIQKKAKIACKESKGTDTEEIACAISKEVQRWEISSQGEMTQNIEDLIQIFRLKMPHLEGYEHIFEEIEGIRNEIDLVKQYKIVCRIIGLVPMFSSMPDHVVQDIREIKEKTTSLSNELKYLQLSVDRLTESVDELQNPQEYLDTIQRNLEEIKNDIPEMKEKIDEVLYELYSPLSTTQKLKVAIPIIPSLVSYEMETDVPKLVADKIDELKNLILRFKKSK